MQPPHPGSPSNHPDEPGQNAGPDVFISHAEEDKEVALAIATTLEASGYRAWVYEKRQAAGISYLDDGRAAIESCEAFLLLVSQASVKSTDVNQEVELAHREGKHFVPVRLGMTHDEVRRAKPRWDLIIGTLRSIGYEEARRGEVMAGILQGLRELGVHPGGTPRSLSQPGSARDSGDIEILLVRDPASPFVEQALELYNRRIPLSEQFSPADLARWLRDDLELSNGQTGARDFFFVARANDRIVGLAFFHHGYREFRQWAFFAYLVAEKGRERMGHAIAPALIARIAETLSKEPSLRDCEGFLMEVDDPRLELEPRARRRALSRMQLFEYLASSRGFSLRALDFPYVQPHLTHVPTDEKEHPMVLLLVQPASRTTASLTREQVERLLTYVYLWVYPESYSEVEEETRDYRTYLQGLWVREVSILPPNIPLLDSKRMTRQP